MNHLTTSEQYFCSKCGKKEWSDCGTPFNQQWNEEGDAIELCDSCNREFEKEKQEALELNNEDYD